MFLAYNRYYILLMKSFQRKEKINKSLISRNFVEKKRIAKRKKLDRRYKKREKNKKSHPPVVERKSHILEKE